MRWWWCSVSGFDFVDFGGGEGGKDVGLEGTERVLVLGRYGFDRFRYGAFGAVLLSELACERVEASEPRNVAHEFSAAREFSWTYGGLRIYYDSVRA